MGETAGQSDERTGSGTMEDNGDQRGAAGSASVVLVVDADPLFGMMVEACLDFEGAQVESVGTLAEAREALDAYIAKAGN